MKFHTFVFIILLHTLLIFNVRGQKNDTVFIEEVIISDIKLSSLNPEGNRVVQVIGRNEIEKLPVSNINDLMNYLTSADLRKRGASDIQSDLSIRGGSFEQTLILLNGIRISNPQTGHHNLDFPVELNQVERIEILEGAASRLFGAGAFCGVINIITEGYKKSFIKLDATAGMFGQYGGGVSANIKTGKASNFIAFSGKKCSGYITNTDFLTWKGFYNSSFVFKAGTLGIQAGYSDKGFGANSFYSAKYPNQYEQTKTGFTSVKFSTTGKNNFSAALFWNRHHDRFELFREQAPAWYSNHNFHLTDVSGTAIQLLLHSQIGTTSIRAEYYHEIIHSNVLGDMTGDTLTDIMDSEGFFTHQSQRDNISISIDQVIHTRKVNFSFGLLANYNNRFGFGLYPGMDISVDISRKIKWIASANKSFRIPTFTEIYYKSPTNKANPNILPETAYNIETGIQIRPKGIITGVSVFYRYGKSIIDWVRQPDSLVWQSANITELHTFGTELFFTINLEEYKIKNNPLQSIRLSYSYLNSSKKSNGLISYYALDFLKHKLQIDFNIKLYKTIGLSTLLNYSHRNGTFTDYSTGDEKKYKPYIILDAKLYWHTGNFNIYLVCNNIFNTKYYDFGNLQSSGIWVSGGINYLFNFKIKNKHEK